MSRRPSRVAPVWPRRFMMITALLIIVCAIVGFIALFNTPPKYSVAFPLFLGVVLLMFFEFVLLYLQNRR